MLRLTDIQPFPDALPKSATFTKADLNDGMTILRLAEGCGAILHFGGVSTEHPFEEVLGPNIRGLYHIYEAARREKARVVFASSNHSIGFHERTETIDLTDPFQPDGYYGLSKAYGELMGRLYFDKHGVESVSIRIGSCFPEPTNARALATWLSYPDLAPACYALRAGAQGGLRGDMGCVEQQTHDVVAQGRSRSHRLDAAGQRRSVRGAAQRQGQRQPGRGTLHGRSVHCDRLHQTAGMTRFESRSRGCHPVVPLGGPVA